MVQGRPVEGSRIGQIEESVWGLPVPVLRPFIERYVGYRQAGLAPGRHRGLPSPYLTVIFTLDDPLVLAGHPDPRQPPDTYRTLVGGLHTSPALITHPGRQSGIQLLMSPLGARALLGMPAGELVSIDVEGPAVLGPLADQIGERLREAPDWPGRFAVLDQMLTSRLAAGPAGPAVATEAGAEVSRAWCRLMSAGGRCSVSRLADETGWSERHLRGRFRDETGLTPKAAARVIRFDRARRLLQHRAAAGTGLPPLADLAADCGYYDQAHLAREFRELAGCAPSAWLAEEFRNVQAGPEEGLPVLWP
ncbi:MAG TPA: helix-turn-helix transcriptional regulator [Streptosporangiaceae bacterium]|nr:helix-turn-helix transcriptional regulator [Streptosporangiaceae bacterium]